MRRLYDVTRPVREGMPVWPGDAPCRLEWTARREHGASANVSALCLSAHTGTHVDGPFHVCDDGARVGAVPLDAFLGPARLVDVRGAAVLGDALVAALLDAGACERLLFRTGCWRQADRFPEVFPALTRAAAERLAAAGVRLVGTDAPSVDPFASVALPAHAVLCGAGVAIIENLWLDEPPPGDYELIALPLRLEEADASPLRAVLHTLPASAP